MCLFDRIMPHEMVILQWEYGHSDIQGNKLAELVTFLWCIPGENFG